MFIILSVGTNKVRVQVERIETYGDNCSRRPKEVESGAAVTSVAFAGEDNYLDVDETSEQIDILIETKRQEEEARHDCDVRTLCDAVERAITYAMQSGGKR